MSMFLVDLNGISCVFVHIPKTGGTSIRKGRMKSNAHLYDMSPEWHGLHSFAFVRNPLERIESCWRDFRYLRNMTNLSLEEFIERTIDRCLSVRNIDDPRTIEHHVAPMCHPVHGLQHAKFIGSFDYLQKDFDLFCSQIGVTPFKLEHFRNSSGAPRGSWTRKACFLVEEFYAEDFEIYERAAA